MKRGGMIDLGRGRVDDSGLTEDDMSEQEPWGPDLRKPVLNYQAPEGGKSTGRVVLEALGGVFGYVGLAVGWGILLAQFNLTVNSWAAVPLATVPPLAVIVGASYLLKARAMRIAGYITFGVVLLSCGTCYAMIANIH